MSILRIRWWSVVACVLFGAVCAFVSCGPGGQGSSGAPDPHPKVFGPAATPRIALWAVPGQLRIDPLTGKAINPHVAGRNWRKGNSVWLAASRTVRLGMARNERLGFQLIVEAAGEDLRYVGVRVSDLAGPDGAKIPARAADLFRVWYTEVTEPSKIISGFNAQGLPSLGTGWYGDALIPFRVKGWGAPFSVPRGRNQAVWIDLDTPKKIPAGTYRGRITVTADRAKAAVADIELTVWDFDVPDKLNARAEAPIYRATIPGMWRINERSDLALKLERQFYLMAREHRFIPYVYDTYPDIKGSGADIEIDWTFYDKRHGPYLDGSAFPDCLPIEHWNVPVDTYWPGPRGGNRRDPKTYYARIEKVVKAFDEHFTEKGWKPRMYVYFQGLDEPSTQAKYDELKRLAQVVHRASKRVKFRHDFFTPFTDAEKMIGI